MKQSVNQDNFRIFKKDKKSQARLGEIATGHGQILTPAFVPVGSQATVKSMTPQELKKIGVQIFFANTYHLYLRPGLEVIEKMGGLHRLMNWEKPLITDSGGFQVFSLGQEKLTKIDYHGVMFRSHLDGSKHYFTPEVSIEIQKKLGADMMVAFDECAPYPVSHNYAKMAMQRTHRWAQQSLDFFKNKRSSKQQMLFGVIQGSVFKDLREESAKFISHLPFDGLAIGGVAVGESKQEMVNILDWLKPVLSKEKRPIHLLGVGEVDDVFAAVERGVDSMDCVIPTRLGRMGWVLFNSPQDNFKYDLTKAKFSLDKRSLDPECGCEVCQNFSRAYLNHLFRARELLAYRLVTYHNLFFMEQLFAKIRESIKKGFFTELKKQWLNV